LRHAELTRLYNVTRQTFRKWQNRNSLVDGSHCPKTLKPEQELILVELRTKSLLPTDDLLSAAREFINLAVYCAGLDVASPSRSPSPSWDV
jgi:hypothetical protein